MKRIFLSILSFIFISANLLSQDIDLTDSLRKGVSYKFILYDDTEVIGKVVRSDSVYVFVKGEDGSYKLRREDIFFVSRNLLKNNFKTVLSLGGGTAILNTSGGGYRSDEFKNTVSLQLSSLIPLGEHKGIRVDAGYSGWSKDETIVSQPENTYYKTGPRTKDYVYLKGDFVFGLLAPENRFWIYGSAGIGIHYANESAYNYSYNSYYGYDSTYHIYSSFVPERRFVSAALSIGAALGYRITDRFGVYADAQLNTIGYEGFFLFFWGGEGSYIPIRAGITYTIY